jgi:hypothetical protein
MDARGQERMVGRAAALALIIVWTVIAGPLAAQRIGAMSNPFKGRAARLGVPRATVVSKLERAPKLEHMSQARMAPAQKFSCGTVEPIVVPGLGMSMVETRLPFEPPYAIEQRDPRRLQRSRFHWSSIVASYLGVRCHSTSQIVTLR